MVYTGVEVEVVDFKPEVPKKKKVNVEISKPDSQGFFDITFSEKIRMPTNFTDWDWVNEGTQKLLIEYLPSETTQTFIYDQDLQVNLEWRVVDVNETI